MIASWLQSHFRHRGYCARNICEAAHSFCVGMGVHGLPAFMQVIARRGTLSAILFLGG